MEDPPSVTPRPPAPGKAIKGPNPWIVLPCSKLGLFWGKWDPGAGWDPSAGWDPGEKWDPAAGWDPGEGRDPGEGWEC